MTSEATAAPVERTPDELVARLFDASLELDRMSYGFSVLTCLPAAMTERPTAATGTVMRESMMRRIAAEAGYSNVDRLDEPALDMLRFYLLTP